MEATDLSQDGPYILSYAFLHLQIWVNSKLVFKKNIWLLLILIHSRVDWLNVVKIWDIKLKRIDKRVLNLKTMQAKWSHPLYKALILV